MMTIEFTKHALARMQERGISQDDVMNTLDNPIDTVSVENNRQEPEAGLTGQANPICCV